VISAGLAINRRGEPLYLPHDKPVDLLVQRPENVVSASSPFKPCEIAQTITLGQRLSSEGYYLLAIAPATQRSDEFAQHSGLNRTHGSQTSETCTHRYEEMGVQFKLVPLQQFVSQLSVNASNRRSALAHLCLGTKEWINQLKNPTPSTVQYGLVESIRQQTDPLLTACDVPLAVFQFQANTLPFVDVWAVRRPCFPLMRPETWLQDLFIQTSPRPTLEAIAFLLQFQAHLEDIRKAHPTSPIRQAKVPFPIKVRASAYFQYLPAAGYLPLPHFRSKGFDINTFFDGIQVYRENDSDFSWQQARRIFHESFYEAPLDITGKTPIKVDLYLLPEIPGNGRYAIFLRHRPLYQTLKTLTEQVEALREDIPRAWGSCTYSLTPDTWQETLPKIAAGGKDAHICLQVGTYELPHPIEIANKGAIKLTGAGPGTRLVARNSEVAVLFKQCQQVIVRDIAVESGKPNSDTKREKLQGALSFYDCREVTVEQVACKSAQQAVRSSTCITVSPSQKANGELNSTRSQVRIHHCDLDIGHQQIGILLINPQTALVQANHLHVTEQIQNWKTLLGDRRVARNLRKFLIADVQPTPSQSASAPETGAAARPPRGVKGKTDRGLTPGTLTYAGYQLSFTTDPSLVADGPGNNVWATLVATLNPTHITQARELQKYVVRLAEDLIQNEGMIESARQDAIAKLMETLQDQAASVASQGIVVGGTQVGDIHIRDNHIEDVLQGIHIGVSHAEKAPGDRDLVETVRITENRIKVLLPTIHNRERHGIFVGNCQNLRIENNDLALQRVDKTKDLPIDAIRVFGELGFRAIIRQNHLAGTPPLETFSTGIYFHPLKVLKQPMWLIENNYLKGARQAIKKAAAKYNSLISVDPSASLAKRIETLEAQIAEENDT
jgi:hypothetical protein